MIDVSDITVIKWVSEWDKRNWWQGPSESSSRYENVCFLEDSLKLSIGYILREYFIVSSKYPQKVYKLHFHLFFVIFHARDHTFLLYHQDGFIIPTTKILFSRNRKIRIIERFLSSYQLTWNIQNEKLQSCIVITLKIIYIILHDFKQIHIFFYFIDSN